MLDLDEKSSEIAITKEIIDKVAASECVFCGTVLIDSVHEPFIILPEEQKELDSWKI